MKAAVIGGDAAGLTIAWLLSLEMEVDLYEKSERLGSTLGHLDIPYQGRTIPIERGETYFFPSYHRNLQNLLEHLNIYTEPRRASYRYQGDYPFSAASLLFSQSKHHRFAPFANKKISKNINHFIHRVQHHRDQNIPPTNLMLKQYMTGLNIETQVMNEILPSLFGLIWHYPRDEALSLSADHCLIFLDQSRLLHQVTSHNIRFIPAGFNSYINKMLFKGHFVPHLNRPITKVSRQDNTLALSDQKGSTVFYDQVIFCCSIETVYTLLHPLSDEERNIFREIHYTNLPFFLHQDSSIVPASTRMRRHLFTLQPYDIHRGTNCAYHTNLDLIQNVPADMHLYLSANCQHKPSDEKILLAGIWRRPHNRRTMIQAIQHLERNLQGRDGIWYCTNHSYNDTSPMTTGIGAALNLAQKMRISLPFHLASNTIL